MAISSGVRGKKVLAPSTSRVSALDHDVHSKSSLTPSVTMICDIPEDICSPFYRGEVHVCIKDTIFEASSPFRHATELGSLLLSKGDVPPVLLLYTDGGPDHRLTYPSVKVALICLFLRLDIDFLVAARTAPGQSWANPIEWIMSLLNLALQNVALSRESSTDTVEAKPRSCNSMADIRKLPGTHPEIENAWRDSVQPIIQLINSQFQRLSLKGKPVQSGESTLKAEIDVMSALIFTVDSSVDHSNLRKKDIEKNVQLTQFLATHTGSRHYTFQIRKCNESSCGICRKPRLSPQQLEMCSWLPDPQPNLIEPSEYLSFKDLYGKDTTEMHRPGLKSKCEDRDGGSNLFTGQRVRNVVVCQECLMPRCVYAQYTLTQVQKAKVERIYESMDFTFGSDLFPADHEFYKTVYVKTKLDCNSRMEMPYYSCTALPMPPICYYCAAPKAERPRASKIIPQCDAR